MQKFNVSYLFNYPDGYTLAPDDENITERQIATRLAEALAEPEWSSIQIIIVRRTQE